MNRGTFNALMIEPEEFRRYAAEHGSKQRALEWRSMATHASPQLLSQFARFLATLAPDANPMQLQSSLVEVFESIAGELLVGGNGSRRSRTQSGACGVERMREILHSSEGPNVDLESLARHAQMTRFQALRAFKRRYGLPPHAYQLCAKLARARALLLTGVSATDVAFAAGFSDQSHFGRHFKRAFGMTPGAYAKGYRTNIASDAPAILTTPDLSAPRRA
ncbi:MAG: AraC family transcriptional regulator [Polyangiaceae bacterium]